MIKYVLKNMWQRKARTFLTVLGIVVGIFALTVLGGLSARLSQQVKGTKNWFTNNITIVPSGGTLFGGGEGQFLRLSQAQEIQGVPGVQASTAGLGITLSQDRGFSFGAPDLIIGLDLTNGNELLKQLPLESGRLIRKGDRGKVVLGANLASKLNARVGGTVDLKGVPFEVVGIYQPTLSAPDQFAFVPYPDALNLFQAANPFVKTENLAGVVYVQAKPGVDKEALSRKIAAREQGLRVISPAQAGKQISQFSLIFNAILFGVGLIALIVGGLSVINTMVMAVSERTREIGLKKAVGAETGAILGEYLLESAMIGLIGGLIGTAIGVVAIVLINRVTSGSQVRVFAVTALVVIGPILFATVLGAVAGVFPALRASRLKPVDALKED
jgi:putative ABC transport system permease protein